MKRLFIKTQGQTYFRNKIKEQVSSRYRERINLKERKRSSKTRTYGVRTVRKSLINLKNGERSLFLTWICYDGCNEDKERAALGKKNHER